MLTTDRQDETTSFQPSLEEITKLQKRLKDAIYKMESNSEINVINHICISNLKSKLERLEEIKKILSIEKYKIVFIGTIGQGKTTAICHLFNLISDFEVSKTIGKKTKNVIETKELLATGSGRTTICEVVLKASAKTYIEIEPYSIEEMESLIFEFCESIANKDSFDSERQVMISAEIERAIRNITGFKITSQTVFDGDKKNIIRTDPAKVLF
ncbi:MAG: hypothetical protein QNJ47_19475 [Nostocaceae cyanobacterium]|nr:hypothetical protein [Nostocaceae cyanobacterium]